MSSPFSKLSFTDSSRMTSAVAAVALVAVGAAVYLSPAGSHRPGDPRARPSRWSMRPPRHGHAERIALRPPARHVVARASHHRQGALKGDRGPALDDPGPATTVTAAPTIPHCSDFVWQQMPRPPTWPSSPTRDVGWGEARATAMASPATIGAGSEPAGFDPGGLTWHQPRLSVKAALLQPIQVFRRGPRRPAR